MARLLRWSIPILFASLLSGAQHYGYVRSGKKTIPGATVTATMGDQKLVTTTDENGLYAFDLQAGDWVFQVEMFGFQEAREERTLQGAASLLDFDLELKRRVMEAPKTAAELTGGYQTIDLKVQAGTAEQLDPQTETTAAPAVAEMRATSDVNEAFLVNGSLSGGLQAVQQQNFFDAIDEEGPVLKKQKKAKTEGGPGVKRAKKAAKKGKKKKKNSIASFGATKEASQIKGSAYFSFRNSVFDARSYSLSGRDAPKPGYAQSRFGFAVGGPMHLGNLIKSDETFFFINYNGLRGKSPYYNVDTVPLAPQRVGDFSQPTVNGPVVLYDPISHLPLEGNLIPSNRVDKISRQLLNYIPLPNLPGSVQNYQYSTAIAQNTDDFSLKLDRNLTEKNKVSLNFNLQNRNGQQAQLFGFQDQLDGIGWQLQAGWTRNLGPRTLNSLHWNFSRNRGNTLPYFAYGVNVAANLGIQGTSPSPINYGPPNLNFTNYGDATDASPLVRRDQTSTIRDAVTLVRGKQNLTFGGEFRRMQLNTVTDSNGRGSFIFSGLLTSGFDSNLRPIAGTGFDFADFLFGFPHSGKVRYGSNSNYFRQSAYNAYVTDDIKLEPHLTFSLGLRYEYFQPFTEKYDRMANLDLATGVTGAAAVQPGGTGPYTGVFPRGLIDPVKNNIAPRLGVAWRPKPKSHLIIRAGYSIFYNGSIYAELPGKLASQPPFAQTTTLLASLENPLRIATGFTKGNTKAINNSIAIDRAYKDGYAQAWNFNVEQNLSKTLALEVGYIGTKGTHLDLQRLPNRALPGSPLTAEDRRLIGNAVGFTYETSDANSILHAGQARLTRKMSKGLSLSALYTYAKSIDNVSTLGGGTPVIVQDEKNLRGERGLSAFDQRHNLSLGFSAQSPVGKGALLAGTPAERLLKSWHLAGTITALSGTPFTARVLGNLADASGSGNLGSSRADATGLPVTGGTGYFNTAAFAPPPFGRYGNAGRNTIPGPSRFALNLSLSRSFHLTETQRLEFRLDGANLSNTPSFTNFSTVINALNYGNPTAAQAMRAFRATMRYKF